MVHSPAQSVSKLAICIQRPGANYVVYSVVSVLLRSCCQEEPGMHWEIAINSVDAGIGYLDVGWLNDPRDPLPA